MSKVPGLKERDYTKYAIRMLPIAALSNLYQSLPGFMQINQLFVFLYLVLLVYCLCKERLAHRNILYLSIGAMLTLFSVTLTAWPFDNAGIIPYYLFCMLSMLFCATNIDRIDKDLDRSRTYYLIVYLIWVLSVSISLIFPSSWQVSRTGQVQFVSLTSSPFQLMPTAFLMLSIAGCLIIKKINKLLLVSLAIPAFVSITSGSRTYFILITILILVVLVGLTNSKKKRIAIALLCIFAIAIIYPMTGVASKNEYILGEGLEYSGNFLNAITSGRADMWAYEISWFFSASPWHMLLGNGFDTIFKINAEATGAELWAHNDFLNIMITHGLVGLVLYVVVVGECMQSLMSKFNVKKAEYISFLIIFWFFNAMFNMFYTYMCAFLAFPYLAMCVAKLTSRDLKRSHLSTAPESK